MRIQIIVLLMNYMKQQTSLRILSVNRDVKSGAVVHVRQCDAMTVNSCEGEAKCVHVLHTRPLRSGSKAWRLFGLAVLSSTVSSAEKGTVREESVALHLTIFLHRQKN